MESYEILKALENDGYMCCSLIHGEKKPTELFGTQLAVDILPCFYDLFENKPKNCSKLALILRSNGGFVDTPLPLVNLIREYFSEFKVFVPENAHSAATLIALGANQIVMSPIGSLSPFDPQINFVNKTDNKTNMSFSVEDIAGYYDLIDKLKIEGTDRVKALEFMTQNISPTHLGQIERIRELIHLVASEILKLDSLDDEKRNQIIKKLVEDIPSHQYRIMRKEALEMGLKVVNETPHEHKTIMKLMSKYKDMLGELEGELIISIPEEQATIEKVYNRGFVETKSHTYAFQTKYIFHRNGKVDNSINEWRKIR